MSHEIISDPTGIRHVVIGGVDTYLCGDAPENYIGWIDADQSRNTSITCANCCAILRACREIDGRKIRPVAEMPDMDEIRDHRGGLVGMSASEDEED